MALENVKKGQELFNTVGCVNCHSLDNKKLYGPALKYTMGKQVTVLRDSTELSVTVDRDYIKRAISNPNFEKRIAFKNSTMAKTTLTPLEIDLITEYLIAASDENALTN
ncbi:c-type cytochrome [Seonamhaeicola marinus]|uniref:c-type cytochrome n=1 Tax=Seonamhaeicola marinus TaxID=1912246 RepID=UPI00165231B5|nr:c-type cytochrome [Seonamhaeicola marinus]